MFSNNTPALFEFSSGINGFAYLRNKGTTGVRLNSMFRKKESYKGGVILCQTHADEVPEPSRKGYRQIKYIKHKYFFAQNVSKGSKRSLQSRGRRLVRLQGPV